MTIPTVSMAAILRRRRDRPKPGERHVRDRPDDVPNRTGRRRSATRVTATHQWRWRSGPRGARRSGARVRAADTRRSRVDDPRRRQRTGGASRAGSRLEERRPADLAQAGQRTGVRRGSLDAAAGLTRGRTGVGEGLEREPGGHAATSRSSRRRTRLRCPAPPRRSSSPVDRREGAEPGDRDPRRGEVADQRAAPRAAADQADDRHEMARCRRHPRG